MGVFIIRAWELNQYLKNCSKTKLRQSIWRFFKYSHVKNLRPKFKRTKELQSCQNKIGNFQ